MFKKPIKGLGILLAFLFTLFLIQGIGLINLKFWGTKYENTRTEIFQETKAYTHGSIRDIADLCLEALTLESLSHRDVLKATIRHRVATFDKTKLPLHVQQCLNKL